MNADVRWIRRFSNFRKALAQLNDAVELSRRRDLTPLEWQGVIQAFEYAHELAWKTLKDFFKERGGGELYGSKDVVRRAFGVGAVHLRSRD